MSYLAPVAILLLVLLPVLLPVTITAGHSIGHWRRNYGRLRKAISPRSAAPAAAA